MPQELGVLASLVYLRLSDNKLTGEFVSPLEFHVHVHSGVCRQCHSGVLRSALPLSLMMEAPSHDWLCSHHGLVDGTRGCQSIDSVLY